MVNYISSLRPDLLDDVCGSLYMVVGKIRETNLKMFVIGGGADFSHVSRFVIDLSALKDTTDEVLEALASFKAMYPETRIVVIADRELLFSSPLPINTIHHSFKNTVYIKKHDRADYDSIVLIAEIFTQKNSVCSITVL